MPVNARMVLGKSKLTWSGYLQGASRARRVPSAALIVKIVKG